MQNSISRLWHALDRLACEHATAGQADYPPLPNTIRARIWGAIVATTAVVVINALLTRI